MGRKEQGQQQILMEWITELKKIFTERELDFVRRDPFVPVVFLFRGVSNCSTLKFTLSCYA